jgi:signal transduction histidine kinase
MTGKGLTWTAAHLREANTPEEVRAAVAEARGQLGDTPVPMQTVIGLLEELAADSARLRVDLRTATRTREALLACVAHDLRNPLNTFAMGAGLLRDDLEGTGFDKARALNLLTRMERASGRMQGLIEDLLEASQASAGSIEIVRRPEQAAAVLRAAIAQIQTVVGERGARLEEGVFVDDDVLVELDRARTIDAIDKLAGVALRSIGEGAVVRCCVERVDANVVFSVRVLHRPGSVSVPPFDEGRGGLALLIARGVFEPQNAQLGIETSTDGIRLIVTFPLHR